MKKLMNLKMEEDEINALRTQATIKKTTVTDLIKDALRDAGQSEMLQTKIRELERDVQRLQDGTGRKIPKDDRLQFRVSRQIGVTIREAAHRNHVTLSDYIGGVFTGKYTPALSLPHQQAPALPA